MVNVQSRRPSASLHPAQDCGDLLAQDSSQLCVCLVTLSGRGVNAVGNNGKNAENGNYAHSALMVTNQKLIGLLHCDRALHVNVHQHKLNVLDSTPCQAPVLIWVVSKSNVESAHSVIMLRHPLDIFMYIFHDHLVASFGNLMANTAIGQC